jgi:uncharacterized protein
MISCFFASDLHGRINRYEKLFEEIESHKPQIVFLGGDLLPSGLHYSIAETPHRNFITDFLTLELLRLKKLLGSAYPQVFLILGNDDGRFEEKAFKRVAALELWHYIHNQKAIFGNYSIYGYSYIPPSPFLLKDWERYDVSQYCDPGCLSPEEGVRTVPVSRDEQRYTTIKKDLELLTGNDDLSRSVFLFHSPPHKTRLDLAALEGKLIDGVPLDPHVGSIAVRQFIETRQPLVTLHGHVHESSRLSGSWQDKIGQTLMFSGAYDGPELALVRFDLENPSTAIRQLL